jgi:Bax protein
MELEHKKSLFISQMLHQILIAKFFLRQEKEILKQISDIKGINRDDYKEFINKQLLKHDADNTNHLLQKLSTYPTSIVLAQAAIESNWGRTRAYVKK